MKVIKNGLKNKIVAGTDLEIRDTLEPKIYDICWCKEEGYFLEETKTFEIKEQLYGSVFRDTKHVLDAYERTDRGLGILLSGNKGLGKTLMAKNISIEAIAKGLPVVLMKHAMNGVVDFLQTIEQDCVVFMDEFDKLYTSIENRNDDVNDNESTQEAFLNLFDGLATHKRLYIVTCNSLGLISTYLLNRPGRLHYHYKFAYPSEAIIRKYMEESLTVKDTAELIADVIELSRKFDLSYDVLRAICFEINEMGAGDLETAAKNLNILNEDQEKNYMFKIWLGGSYKATLEQSNRCNPFISPERVCFEDADDFRVWITVPPKAIKTISRGKYSVDTANKNIRIYYRGEDDKSFVKPELLKMEIFEREDYLDIYKKNLL